MRSGCAPLRNFLSAHPDKQWELIGRETKDREDWQTSNQLTYSTNSVSTKMRYRNSKAQIFGSAFYSSNFKLHFRIDCFDSRVKRINRPQLKSPKNWKVYLVTKSVLNSFLDATCFPNCSSYRSNG